MDYLCISTFVGLLPIGMVILGVIVWAKQELENFVEIYKRQVFGSKAGISAVADCVYIARNSCYKVSM